MKSGLVLGGPGTCQDSTGGQGFTSHHPRPCNLIVLPGGRWTDTLGKAFLIIFHLFFFFFQGPIGLDGKPVSKELLCRLPALPPARSHCAASLPYTVCLKGIILQCHAHVWIKRKLGGWQAGGCHRCLEGDAGVRRLRKAEHGLFLSR